MRITVELISCRSWRVVSAERSSHILAENLHFIFERSETRIPSRIQRPGWFSFQDQRAERR
jgi:hypothetical protein